MEKCNKRLLLVLCCVYHCVPLLLVPCSVYQHLLFLLVHGKFLLVKTGVCWPNGTSGIYALDLWCVYVTSARACIYLLLLEWHGPVCANQSSAEKIQFINSILNCFGAAHFSSCGLLTLSLVWLFNWLR